MFRGSFVNAVSKELRCPTKSVTGFFVTQYFRKEKKFLANRAVKLLNIESDDNVLEIGFGIGDGLLSASERVENGNGRIYGVERSAYQSERAKKHCSLEISSNKINIHRSPVTHLPFHSNFFDKIFHCNEYYFWDDKSKCVAEIFRILKPGGIMICTLKLDKLKNLESKGYIHVYPDPLDFMDILDYVGFEDVKFDYHDQNKSEYFQYQSISAVKPVADEITDEQLEDEEYEFTRQIILHERLIKMKQLNEPLPKDKRLKEDDV